MEEEEYRKDQGSRRMRDASDIRGMIVIYIYFMEGSPRVIHFVVFVNTKSGNGDGKRFLSLGYQQLVIHFDGNSEGHLYFIDLFIPQSTH